MVPPVPVLSSARTEGAASSSAAAASIVRLLFRMGVFMVEIVDGGLLIVDC
jgi:hypothetical protein